MNTINGQLLEIRVTSLICPNCMEIKEIKIKKNDGEKDGKL